jgi:hypothetical protein
LSRLRAGLDRDEQLARAAADFPYDDPSDAPWIWMRAKVAQGVAMTSDAHFARQDPQSTLRRVEAIRKVIADIRDPKTFEDHYSGAIDYDSFRCGVDAAAEFFTEALASIYPEPTDETEKP